MHIFWLNHGLHFHPDNQEEANMMVSLAKNAIFGKPSLEHEQRRECVIGNHEVVPGAFAAGEFHDQKTVSAPVEIGHELAFQIGNEKVRV